MPVKTSHRHRSLSFLVYIAAMVVVAVAVSNQPALALSSPGSNYPNRKVALVTGANKGIGYEIAKKILSHKVGDKNGSDSDDHAFVCILGCRSEELGKAAADALASDTQNSAVEFVKIDLLDHESIASAASRIEDTYGRCDVLINNAAVCYNDPTLYGTVPRTPFAEQAEITIATNFFGTLALTRAMLPLLNKSDPNSSTPRIINIASSAGRLSIIPSEEKRTALSSESLSFGDLEASMKEFVKAAKEGRHTAEGWPNTGYGVSKVGIIAMTKILARQYCGSDNKSDDDDDKGDSEPVRRRMMVNSVDPGYCATDQNNNQGVIPAERGAVTPYLLATLNDNDNGGFSGKHWYQEREIEW